MDLGYATQRVWVLDLVRRWVMAGHERRFAQEPAQLRGDGDLAGVGPRELVCGGVGHVGAQQRLATNRRGHARGPGQSLRVGSHQRADGAHHLGAVEEGQPLLGLQLERFEVRRRQRFGGGHDATAHLHMPPTRERQGEMRQRGQIARCAHRTLRRHDRVDAEAQQIADSIDHDGPAAGVAEGQGVGPQQQHRPHHVARQRFPDAGSV